MAVQGEPDKALRYACFATFRSPLLCQAGGTDHLMGRFLKHPALLGEVAAGWLLLTTRLYPALFSTRNVGPEFAVRSVLCSQIMMWFLKGNIAANQL